MIKKRNIGIIILFLILIPQTVFAADTNYGYYGTTSSTASKPLYANSSNGDAAHWIDISVGGSGTGYVVWGKNDGTGHLVEMSRSPVPADAVQPPGSGAIAFWLESTGGEIYATIGHTTNPNSLTVYFTSGSSGGGDGGGSSSCDACQIFSCPGWGEYMQGLQDIKNAIPPAPNWQAVANTFRDTIAPQIKSDMSSLLGWAPEPPSAPAAPATPPLLSDLDNHGLSAPTGQEDAGLGSSTFDANDIKNSAPIIQERQDPTGGFSILDPIAALPSQDEFMKNKPNEGTATIPGNPKDDANIAPKPAEGDNTAPKPPESANPTPANPKDDGNIAPKPPSSDNIAPKPPEGDNYAPSAPKDDTNTAPKPQDTNFGSPGSPKDGGNIAPRPGGTGGGFDTAPIPKNDGSTAPLPNESGTAPIPAKDNSTAPIPRQ